MLNTHSLAPELKLAEFPAKLQFLFQPKRTKVLYGGRGSAKSWSVAAALVLLSTQSRIRVLCVREQQNSIKESVHKLLADRVEYYGLQSFFDVQRDKIICTATGSEFFFEGIRANVDRIKSYEGIDYCWAEEAHNITRNSWEVLIPTIRKTGSEIWITFNPRLRTDYTYQEFVLREDPNTTAVPVNWRDNPWFPEELRLEMEKLKERDYDAYLNVYEGQCRVLLDGAVYAEELRKLMSGPRPHITAVPHDPTAPVDCFWDLGWADKTAIWFRQKVGFEWRYIDFLSDSQKGLPHYIKLLQDRGYNYGTMWLPHDARNRTVGADMSVESRLRKFFPVRIVKRISLTDGIDAARSHLPLCYFDSVKCAEGVASLGAYRYEVVEEKGIVSKVPIHDDASHAADAFRYAAVSVTQPRSARVEHQAAEMEQKYGLAARAKALARAMGSEFGFGTSSDGGGLEGGTGWMK